MPDYRVDTTKPATPFSRKLPLLPHATLLALGGTLLSNTTLAQSATTGDDSVEEIIVYGTQARLDSVAGSRLNLGLLETPVTIDIIDGDAIRDRMDTSVLEAVTRSAGFTNESNPGNGHFSIGARGFSGQDAVTKLYDSTNYYTIAGTVTFPFDTWGIERVEILKGPSSVIYGQGGVGGAINIIPKTARFDRNEGNLRLLAGEDSTYFVGLDYNLALADGVAARINYGRNSSDNWVDNGDSESDMLSGVLRWQVNPDLILTARYDRGDQEPMRYFGTPVVDGGFLDALVERNFNVGDATIRYRDDALRLRADWTINTSVSLQTELYRLTSDRLWRNAEGYVYDADSMTVERWDPLILGHDIEHIGYRSNLVISPANSPLKFSLGVEGNDIEFERPSNYGPGNPNPIDWDADFDVVDVNNFQPGTLADLTSAQAMLDDMANTDQWAVFGEAQYKLTDRLALVGALRYDDYATHYRRVQRPNIKQDVDALTGRLGAVFDLNDTTAIYAQYGTGASHPNGGVVTVSGSLREADLVESEQIEIGIKNALGNTGLQWSVALFDITKKNLVTDDPDSNNPDDSIVIPEQSSRGLELGLNYALTDTLQLYGNFVTLDAETTNGATPNNVAERSWNLGVAWQMIPTLRLIADARYVDDRYNASLPIPDYTVVDASLHWNATDALSVAVRADNIFDELYASGSYWWGTWIVGKPRTFSVAADFRF